MKHQFLKGFILVVAAVATLDVAAQTRIRFTRGNTSASVSASIGGRAGRTYVLSATSGQALSANVSSQNGCVVFAGGSTGTSYVTNQGNNYLYLNSRCRNATKFTLTVSID